MSKMEIDLDLDVIDKSVDFIKKIKNDTIISKSELIVQADYPRTLINCLNILKNTADELCNLLNNMCTYLINYKDRVVEIENSLTREDIFSFNLEESDLFVSNNLDIFTLNADNVSEKSDFITREMALESLYKVFNKNNNELSSIDWAKKNGIIQGYDDEHLGLNEVCTRAQFLTMLWRINNTPKPININSFGDVASNKYYANAVAWAKETGLISGFDDSTFRPDEIISLNQVNSIIDCYESVNRTNKGFPIEVINDVTYISGIMIVNKTYKLPETYYPKDTYGTVTSETYTSLDGIINEAYYAYEKMELDMQNAGYIPYIGSGYRSYKKQVDTYKYHLQNRNYDVEATDNISARAGYSEHQSGYAFDICCQGYPEISSNGFNHTPPADWLNDNVYKYGFIIRYPENKKEFTGYSYESWHLRYVGKDLAKVLYNDGDWISLEEYFGISCEYTD